jgi:mannosyltransferase
VSAPPAGEVAANRPAVARTGGWAAAAAKYAPVFVAAATMTVLGLWGLARDSSMGNDEVATRWAALLSLRQLAHLLRHVDAVHGTYYLLMHGWVAVGSSPAILRIPSVLGMTAAVALTVIIGRRLTGSAWAGLFAGLIMALTPSISFFAQTARSYAFVLACVLGSTLALLHAMSAEAAGETSARIARRWLIYGALVTLGGYLNEMSLLVLAAHAITVLLARCGRRTVARWAAASAGAALLVAPLMVISSQEAGVVAWIPRPNLRDLGTLLHDYFGGTNVAALLLLGCAVVAVLPPRGRWRRRQGGGAETGATAEPAWWRSGGVSLPSVAAPLLVMPGSVLILESLVARPLYVDRYVLYGEAGAALLVGGGLCRIGRWLADTVDRRALVWAPGVVVCVCALLLQLAPQHRVRTPQSRMFDFGGPARYVAAHAQTGDGVLFFNAFYRKARLGYPGDFDKVSDFAMAVSPLQAGTFRGTDKPLDVTLPLMLARQRIWVLGNAPSAQLAAPLFRAESLVLERRFSLIAERPFKGITVTLWRRR